MSVGILYYGVSADEKQFIKEWAYKHQVTVDRISENLTRETAGLARDYDGICLFPDKTMQTDERIYQKLAEVGIKQLSIKSTGVDGINFAWAKKYQLQVTNVPNYSRTSVAHFALMSILMLLRSIPEFYQEPTLSRKSIRGRELQDVVVGILGTGKIGAIVAQAISDLGGHVIAYSESKNPALAKSVRYVSFDELLQKSDVLSLHVPLTAASTYLLSDKEFAKMKKGACIVNTARGKILDTKALIRWAKTGACGGLALDTLEDEEIFTEKKWRDNPFYQALAPVPNTFLTPHIAYHTDLAVKEIVETTLDNVCEVLESGNSVNLINN